MKRVLFSLLIAGLILLPENIRADDDFGFDSGGGSSASSPSFSAGSVDVRIGGEVSAELLAFTDDFETVDKIKQGKLGDVFSGALNFSVSGSAADAVINLNLAPVFDGSASPVTIDEAYVRAYFGPVNVEGGVRKLTWGKADSLGPLDVINPLDYTDLTKISDPMDLKIGRPLVHISWGIGNFSKLEGVFVPWFQGHHFATNGRWAPAQITEITGLLSLLPDFNIDDYYKEDRQTLEYAQSGLRFTTTIGSSDMGLQYYYGRLPRPALDASRMSMDYNAYHQVGVDYAQVLFGFNVRAEAAANITEDLKGDKGDIYNPSLAWSLGFDRDLIGGINVNFQATESIRLFHDKIGKDPLVIDTEEGKDITSTRLTLILSKKFFRDQLELKAAGLWDIEEKGFLVMPSIAWIKNDVSVKLSGGIFGGDEDGELGQYRDNHFIKTVLTYRF